MKTSDKVITLAIATFISALTITLVIAMAWTFSIIFN